MATSPSAHNSGFFTPMKTKLTNRFSGSFHKRSYNQFEASPSTDDFSLNTSSTPDEFSSISPTLPSSHLHKNYIFTKDNYVLFHVQFTRVECGLFKDLININTPVQEVIFLYSKFFHDNPRLRLFTGPKIGVMPKAKFGRTRSLSLSKMGNTYQKLVPTISLAEQNITSSYLLIISPSSDAKFNKESFQTYLNSKTEDTHFVERWLPAVQGCVPLNEDAACVVAASLYTLNSMRNSATGGHNSPRDFIHKEVAVSKSVETKLGRALEDMKQESAESIMKLCTDTILSNFLSAAIIFSVSMGVSISNETDTYLVISSESILLVKKSNLTRILTCIQLSDIKSWKHSGNVLDIEHLNRPDLTSIFHLMLKTKDAALIGATLSAIGHALADE
eukprot:TRINITY_DN265_c0_g1_i1.p1 TRINITY_DN265_c0_g1~~TRINITY_DN265_c0_g1_i1.p1  ORF type:complete len:389 (-),score=64.90 TRINITY_DN265_c0_g1_i1:448-1614(-)